VEAETMELRKLYMPLFNAQHVRMFFSGHEHLFEHWVEHYTDAEGTHRMDLVVSGGGGAPIYAYTGEPDLQEYLKANEASKVTIEYLVKPSVGSRLESLSLRRGTSGWREAGNGSDFRGLGTRIQTVSQQWGRVGGFGTMTRGSGGWAGEDNREKFRIHTKKRASAVCQ